MVKPELDGTKDYYKVLGISGTASQLDIRKAFLDLARTQHPDKNPGHELVFKAKFQIITTAYDVLKDPISKRAYDAIRPISRVAEAKNTAVPNFRSTKKEHRTAATGAAPAQATAFPRQAKTGSKSSPRKTPTARKDPFYDWTPPVPQRNSFKTQQDNFSEPIRPTQPRAPQSTPKRAQNANQPAFSYASPASPLRSNPLFGQKGGSHDRKASVPKAKNTAPDWTLKEKWWGQSGTAYSTFHTPSSKYSPYAKDPKDTATDAPSKGRASDEHPTKNDIPDDKASTTFFARETQADTTQMNGAYEWQRSETAYQRAAAKSRGQSGPSRRKNPLMEEMKTCNPFFENQFKAARLDADRLDDLDDSDDDQAVPDQKKKGVHASRRSSQSTETLDISSSDTSSVGSSKRQSQRFVPNRHNVNGRPMATPRGFAKYRQTTVASDTESDEERAEASQNTRPKTRQASPEKAQTPFSFKLDVTPKSNISSSSARRVSQNVPPSVQFNAVPDLNFSSPNQSSPFPQKGPFSSPAVLTPAYSVKKHPRVDDRSDPRYDSESTHDHVSSVPITLADQLARTTLETDMFSSKACPVTSQQTGESLPASQASVTFDLPRYPVESSGSSTPPNDTGEPSHDEKSTLASPSDMTIPSVPAVLLTPIGSHGDFDTSLTQYLTQCSIFNAYTQEWLEYEKDLIARPQSERALLFFSYHQALVKYQEVLRVHAETYAAHTRLVAAQLNSAASLRP